MTDEQLNGYISSLLGVPKIDRVKTFGHWAGSFDAAMAMWEDRHPGTLPPAFENLGPPASCFEGELPPIFTGKLR